VIERDARGARLYRDDSVVANAWRQEKPGWRARSNNGDDPVANNRERRSALSKWRGRDDGTFAWVTAPVLNKDTRLTVDMCPASGRLAVMGWEPDGNGMVEPVTKRTEIVGERSP
jgi:hypothetical protein